MLTSASRLDLRLLCTQAWHPCSRHAPPFPALTPHHQKHNHAVTPRVFISCTAAPRPRALRLSQCVGFGILGTAKGMDEDFDAGGPRSLVPG
ncbi:hypothetical protein BJV78DRAFT_1236802 [Lactifluus subvellereus]|nr:hypothetical protein BJV78DRAFT_1236802 [Lactifluus subvellereus]